MKNFRTKAFTLVEMLIVIVIIGILIAALLPRLQGAQSMARDTSRRTALSQLQAGIVAYQALNGHWTAEATATGGISTNDLTELITAGMMTDLPKDPNSSDSWTGAGGTNISGGGYSYKVVDRNGNKNGGFVLMAKTETPGNSNWVMPLASDNSTGAFSVSNMDLRYITPCSSVAESGSTLNNGSGEVCYYQQTSQLRYIVLY